MFEWFDRCDQRQRDLAAGVDADLVRSNRKKWRIWLWLLGVGFVLLGVDHFAKFHGLIQEIVRWISGLLFVGAMLLGYWAQQESAFLNTPDPKKPPSLFK
ncbi:MAG TPA: hypothetical protein VGU63_12360 [Candidatus Acidoferrales bacterium]|nr:hypothetical protein [Candidatus Acidoferrales bacterium]